MLARSTRLVSAVACLAAATCTRSEPSSAPPVGPSPAPARDEPAAPGAPATIAEAPAPPAATASPPASSSAPAPATTAVARPARAAGELPGDTIDFPYDGRDVGDPSRAYEGRAFVHDAARVRRDPLPLVVFLHGLNRELIPHRWMGGGNEGDVRRIVAELIDRGRVDPVILAGPGSVVPAAVSYGASFPVFDLDRFVAQTEAALPDGVRVDRARIVVTGHSGAGCSDKGGLAAAVVASVVPLAIVSIDTCMPGALAEALGRAAPTTHVVVTWQTVSWDRNFDHFRKVFRREVKAHPPPSGVLRELDALPAQPKAHDATVGQTFEKWLPRLLPAAGAAR